MENRTVQEKPIDRDGLPAKKPPNQTNNRKQRKCKCIIMKNIYVWKRMEEMIKLSVSQALLDKSCFIF